MHIQNIIALIITFAAALIFLRIMDFTAQKGWVGSRTSRKLIHIGTGPIFVICWLLFNDASYTRWLAALVPLSITIQFALVGMGIMKDEGAVQGMSRTGDPREILRGPLYYGIVFVLLTLVFWKDSPIGIVALMMLCGGDGVAEILGRNYGKTRLPWNKGKSWIGSAGFIAGGWILSMIVLWIFQLAGVFSGGVTTFLLPVSLVALGSMLVESVTPHDLDNLTIPATAVILGLMLF